MNIRQVLNYFPGQNQPGNRRHKGDAAGNLPSYGAVSLAVRRADAIIPAADLF